MYRSSLSSSSTFQACSEARAICDRSRVIHLVQGLSGAGAAPIKIAARGRRRQSTIGEARRSAELLGKGAPALGGVASEDRVQAFLVEAMEDNVAAVERS